MLQPEGDSLSDDLLFGSGPANWNGSAQSPSTPNPVTDTRMVINQLHDLHTDGDRDDNYDRLLQNTTPRPNSQGAEGGARPKVNNSDRPGPQTLAVRNETRNKSTKDKENKHKNSKKKENSVQNGWFHNVSSNNTTDPNWSPALQLVQYNQAVKKNGNGVKHKKQTMNENSALANNSVNSLGSVSLHGNSNVPSRQRVIQNTPDDQVCANDDENESEEFLNLPSGIDPNSDPSRISRIYVRPGHVIPPNPLPGLKTDSSNSVSENIETKSPSVNRIHNNLWENSKNCNVKEIPNIQNGLCLNAFRNDIDIETDSLPLACADLPGIHRQSSNPGLSADQIVNHFPGSNISANMNGHANSPTFQQNGDSQITVPYYVPSDITGDELSINLESLQSNLPTDLFFGDGNYENDYLYAQQLQMQYDKQNSDYRTQMQYDDFTNMDYLNLSGDQRRSIASKQVNNARRENNCDRVMNDVYDPELLDDGLSDSLFMTSQNQEADDDVRMISPDVRYGLPAYPDPSLSPSNSHCLRGQSFEDEQLARQIAEEIRIKEDEDLARQLQMQDDLEQRVYPVPHPVSRRPDINEYRENSEPLHARYNRAWQTWQRPLTVPTSRHGNNVMDSTIRGVSSTERPLARRVPLDLVELEYLENIHSPTNEYRLLPGGRGQYEFNPDYMLDDYGEESLVSINRDPRMLATLLMERSPNMMIPNEIDLNDYEALWELAEGLGEVKRVGMEHNEILALPVHIYKGPTGSDDNKTDCLVCLSEFKKGEELRTLPCCHIYHVTCIDEWLRRNAICPVCRQSASQRG